MTRQACPADEGRRRSRSAQDLRASRPLVGGALLVAAGLEIIWVDGRGGVSAVVSASGGSTPALLGAALVLLGVLAWVTPVYAPMIGLMALGVAVLSFVAANLGGYLIGSVLGVLGGALVFAWRTDRVLTREVQA